MPAIPQGERPTGSAYSADALSDGFRRTVLGSEFGGFGAAYVRKFSGPVRFHVRAPVATDRKRVARVKRFLKRADRLIDNFDVVLVDRVEAADFVVHLVPRSRYATTIRQDVYGREDAPVRGRCMVRAVFSSAGIQRSDAVIVTDEGNALFNRCMVEEILQGLGPLNDDPSLSKSIFNDTSRFTNFRRFDRLLLNILYDPRIQNGDDIFTVNTKLPEIVKDTLKRIGAPRGG